MALFIVIVKIEARKHAEEIRVGVNPDLKNVHLREKERKGERERY